MYLCKKRFTSALIIIGKNAYNGDAVLYGPWYIRLKEVGSVHTHEELTTALSGKSRCSIMLRVISFLIYVLKLSLHFTLCIMCIEKALGGRTQTVSCWQGDKENIKLHWHVVSNLIKHTHRKGQKN